MPTLGELSIETPQGEGDHEEDGVLLFQVPEVLGSGCPNHRGEEEKANDAQSDEPSGEGDHEEAVGVVIGLGPLDDDVGAE